MLKKFRLIIIYCAKYFSRVYKKMRIFEGPNKGMLFILKRKMNNEYYLGSYENDLYSIFYEHINKGDVVFDVGAHVGYFTISFSKITGNSGKVFSFEPFPNNFNLLYNNILINKIKNAKLFNFV